MPEDEKRLWADSILWEKAPELIVEKWLTDKPDTAGKYVLIEFWATWCPPCRRSLSLLNTFHEKYKDELVVIGISDETEADVRKLKDPQINFYSAIDTQARTKKQLGVFGIPHVLLIEPEGYVVWEGFPLLKGHELTEEIIEHTLSVGRNLKEQQAAQ
ncbi:MAG: TlpA family protein disulfide reductase [Phycisphaerae bacterium]|nr:TlpA family protein disulfide reductase [Phycisphaerae bacterium]